MGVEREQPTEGETADPFEARWAWKGGAVAGLVATAAMGVVISLTRLETLRLAIAGLYGFEGSLLAGWAAHLFHGSLFGVIFAAILSDPGLYRVSEWLWKSVVAGVVFGMMLAIVGAGIIMPIWLGAVGLEVSGTMPNVTGPSLVWHFVYGAVLGALYPFVEDL